MKRSFTLHSGAWYFTPTQLKPGNFDTIMIKVEFNNRHCEEFAIEFLYDSKHYPICKIVAFNDSFNALAACNDLTQALGDLFSDDEGACPFAITAFLEHHLGFTDRTEYE